MVETDGFCEVICRALLVWVVKRVGHAGVLYVMHSQFTRFGIPMEEMDTNG